MAGLGAAINTGNVGRGKTVAVIGCGGVGAAAIAGCRAGRGRRRSSPSTSTTEEARAGARELGATHTVNSSEVDAVEAIRALSRAGRHRPTAPTW